MTSSSGGVYTSAFVRRDPVAVTSLCLGIVSLFLGLLFSVAAIITGHIARGRVKRDRLNLRGSGLALAGLIMGYVSAVVSVLVLIAAIALPIFVSQQRGALQEVVRHDVAATVEEVRLSGDVSDASAVVSADYVTVQVMADPTYEGSYIVYGYTDSLDDYVYVYSSYEGDFYEVTDKDDVCIIKLKSDCPALYDDYGPGNPVDPRV